jgi:hypothetical protein
MTAPVRTTLLSPNPATGTTTTDGTEQTLASGAAGGSFALQIDISAMQDGDEAELRAYTKAKSGGTERQIGYARLGPLGQSSSSDQIQPFGPFPVVDDIKITLKRLAGTDRAYDWSVLNLYGS